MTDEQGLDAAQLDALCANWPGATRSIKWEVDLVWSVAGKMFVVLCTLGPERGRLSFKVERERFLELTDQPGFTPAAYMAHAFWVSVAEPQQLGEAELAGYVRQSYDLVRAGLPKKTQAALDAG
jgi:predicted DNA-binding protein (MmcQ/YjbR family)